MVAYGFKRRFIQPIRAGLRLDGWPNGAIYDGEPKFQTIRAPRTGRGRHARPGEELQLYYAMRTKHCLLIGKARCASVDQIDLAFRQRRRSDWVRISSMPHKIDRPFDLDVFARSDGFEDWADLRAFWREEHPDVDDFSGVLIKWAPL